MKIDIPQAEADFEESLKPLNLEAPRITPRELVDEIEDVEYVEHTTPGGRLVRWCVITLKSGFVAVGEPNIVFSPENDRPEFGRALAYEKAFASLWDKEAYSRMKIKAASLDYRNIDWSTITNDPRVKHHEPRPMQFGKPEPDPNVVWTSSQAHASASAYQTPSPRQDTREPDDFHLYKSDGSGELRRESKSERKLRQMREDGDAGRELCSSDLKKRDCGD